MKAASPVQKEYTQSSIVCSISNKSSCSGSPHNISNKIVPSSLLSRSHKESMGGKSQLWSSNTTSEKNPLSRKLSDKGTYIDPRKAHSLDNYLTRKHIFLGGIAVRG